MNVNFMSPVNQFKADKLSTPIVLTKWQIRNIKASLKKRDDIKKAKEVELAKARERNRQTIARNRIRQMKSLGAICPQLAAFKVK